MLVLRAADGQEDNDIDDVGDTLVDLQQLRVVPIVRKHASHVGKDGVAVVILM